MAHFRSTVYLILAGALLLVSLLGAQATGSAWPPNESQPASTIPTRTPGPPVPLNINLEAALQRPNAPPPHPSWAMPVRFTFYRPGDPETAVYTWDLMLNQSGTWQGTLTMVPDMYDLRLKNMHTLRNVKRNVIINDAVTIDMGLLLEGDADDDNRVRSSDFGILRAAYFTNEGNPNFDPRADFDEDKRIRSSDFALLRGNYFKTGDIKVDGTLLTASSAARPTGTVAIALEPALVQVAPGETFMLTLVAHAGDQPFVALDADIRFPPEQLQVIGPDGAPATRIEILPSLVRLENWVNNTTGHILFGAATFEDPLSGDLPAAQIRFRAIGTGLWATIEIVEATVADETGKFVTGPVSGARAWIGDEIHELYIPLIHRAN